MFFRSASTAEFSPALAEAHRGIDACDPIGIGPRGRDEEELHEDLRGPDVANLPEGLRAGPPDVLILAGIQKRRARGSMARESRSSPRASIAARRWPFP